MKSNTFANLTSALLLISTFFAPTLSLAAAPGTLSGNCQIRMGGSAQDFAFNVPANAKVVLGYNGLDDGDYKISIVNNTGVPVFENAWYSLGIGFARDYPGIQNPPILCPTSPEDARQACLEENQRNNPPYIPAPRGVFTRIENNGSIDAEVIAEGNGVFVFNGAQIPSESVRDGLLITPPPASLGGVGITCQARFRQSK